MKFNSKAYLLATPLNFYFTGMFAHVITFVLFWALAYTVTQIY
jgi:hypothetical protein